MNIVSAYIQFTFPILQVHICIIETHSWLAKLTLSDRKKKKILDQQNESV